MAIFDEFDKCRLCWALLDPADSRDHELWHEARGETVPPNPGVELATKAVMAVWARGQSMMETRRARRLRFPNEGK